MGINAGDDSMSDSTHPNPNGSGMGTSRRRSQVRELRHLRDEVTACQAQIVTLQREVDALKRRLGSVTPIPTAPNNPAFANDPADHTPRSKVAPTDDKIVSPRAAEMQWLEDHYDELAINYQGQAIAIFANRVVAADADLAVVVHRARDSGFEDALFTSIPSGEPRLRV